MEARIIGGCCEHLEGNCVPSRIEIACLKEGKRERPRLIILVRKVYEKESKEVEYPSSRFEQIG